MMEILDGAPPYPCFSERLVWVSTLRQTLSTASAVSLRMPCLGFHVAANAFNGQCREPLVRVCERVARVCLNAMQQASAVE